MSEFSEIRDAVERYEDMKKLDRAPIEVKTDIQQLERLLNRENDGSNKS